MHNNLNQKKSFRKLESFQFMYIRIYINIKKEKGCEILFLSKDYVFDFLKFNFKIFKLFYIFSVCVSVWIRVI